LTIHAHAQPDSPVARGCAGDAADLLTVPQGKITEAGLRTNIDVGILYMAAWLDGNWLRAHL
jgi:malate synthase